MWTLVAIPLTCWFCVLVALPRKPLPGNEVQELVYGSLLGRYQRLVLIAAVATVVAALTLFIALAHHTGARGVGSAESICVDTPGALPTCYRQMVGGWQEEHMQADGTWQVVRTGLAHPPVPEKDEPPGG
jgi:hypothetical protein